MEKEQQTSIKSLLEEGTLKIGQKPKGNPQEIPSRGDFAIFLSEEDYPALSPAMWNQVASKFNVDSKLVFLVAEPDKFSQIVAAIKNEPNLKGGVLGVGFKDEAVDFLDKAEPMVKISRSANVFTRDDQGQIEGFNTDALGFVKSLNDKLAELGRGGINGKKIVVLGAGGTGSAIVFKLGENAKEVVVLNRTVKKASKISQEVNDFYHKDLARYGGEDEIAKEISNADVIINTTTKGATGEFREYAALTGVGGEWTIEKNQQESKKLLAALAQKPLVCDVVLVSADTPTIALAKEAGLPTLDGRPMNLEQAIPAIKLVFPQTANISDSELKKVMRQAQQS